MTQMQYASLMLADLLLAKNMPTKSSGSSPTWTLSIAPNQMPKLDSQMCRTIWTLSIQSGKVLGMLASSKCAHGSFLDADMKKKAKSI